MDETIKNSISELINKRGCIKAQLTRFKTYLDSNQGDFDVDELQIRLARVDPLFDEFNNVQTRLQLLNKDVDYAEESLEFEERFFSITLAATKLIKSKAVSHNASATSLQSTSNIQSTIRLPEIKLPVFTGVIENWYDFYNTFKSLIDENPALSNIEKFQYLKASLKAEAAELISAIEISEVNYETALEIITQRYDNKRLIVDKHIEHILNLPNMQRDSFQNLRQIIDGVSKHVRILDALKVPVNTWDAILNKIITNKLDTATIKEWEGELIPNELPTVKRLLEYLNKRCNVLEVISRRSNNPRNEQIRKANLAGSNKKQTFSLYADIYKTICSYCSQMHSIYRCERFAALTIQERLEQARVKALCFRCLRKHAANLKCSAKACFTCKKTDHNSLLHKAKDERSSNESEANNATLNHLCETSNQVLLSTAVIYIKDTDGNYETCRVLLDSGAQMSLITEGLVKRLRLKGQRTPYTIKGIGRVETEAALQTKVSVKSRYNNYEISTNCIILDNITGYLPTVTINKANLKIPPNIRLADPKFNVSQEIDLLIGAEIFYDLLCTGQFRLGKNQPTFQKTVFGWIVAGTVISSRQQRVVSCNLTVTNEQLDAKLRKFWEVEEYADTVRGFTPGEAFCLKHFDENYTRNTDGRFIVKMPIKQHDLNKLGESRRQAEKRFYALERKLNKNHELKTHYHNFINEYLELGHMQRVDEVNSEKTLFFLPHHAVTKSASLTTKLRVVFDGSAKTSTGLSLNDIQEAGPTLQQDLFSILIRFRTHRYVITADICKMYRQVLIDESQRKLLRILWRDSQSDELSTYELKTVTYGIASSSFLAINAIQRLAHEENSNFPYGAQILLRDFYVDDLLTGASTVEEVNLIRYELDSILNKGKFQLRKWTSNSSEVLKAIDSNSKFAVINLDKDQDTNALGLQWNAKHDTFSFSSALYQDHHVKTSKRNILSRISQVFDPLGLLGPIIVKAKLIVQSLWSLKLHWDESVPLSLSTQWKDYQEQLTQLNKLRIDRWILKTSKPINVTLIGFCDASENAYGACVYVHAKHVNNEISVNLLCAKSRVSPLKKLTIARLELCSAVLLARLVNKVKIGINIKLDDIMYFSDSTIVLHWIRSNSRTWKTFVGNRVGDIHRLSEPSSWFHVPSAKNPADMLSRGVQVEELIDSNLWWHGPQFIGEEINRDHFVSVPNNDVNDPEIVNEKRKDTISCALSRAETMIDDVLKRYSSFMKLVRHVAHWLRFIMYLKDKGSSQFDKGPLNASHICNATMQIIKYIQRTSFANEIKGIMCDKPIHYKGLLASLNPFIDQYGVLRVGGRLKNSNIPYTQKHPIILPKAHYFTKLLIRHEHEQNFHCGMQSTLAAVRRCYWPIGAKTTVRQVVKRCIICFKYRPTFKNTLMGDLPEARVTQSRPFLNTGIDYFGPLYIREGRRKNSKVYKAYGAIFICFAIKAIHIELVTDLTTEAFLACLKRFIARRGKPANLYSDNGKNFVGANNELRRLYEIFKQDHRGSVISFAAEQNIAWHFIPPRSAHFGGLWESAVKSVKQLLKKTMGNASLSYDEAYTLLSQIEAILNSRPLFPISDDPNDLTYLSPSHFLIGDYLISNAEPEIRSVPVNRLSRWQHIERLRQSFWRIWHRQYLQTLQTRNKWKFAEPNGIQPGRLVLIREENTPPLNWPMGRVEGTHPGKDGIVRTATIRTTAGVIKRPSIKLCPLPLDSEM